MSLQVIIIAAYLVLTIMIGYMAASKGGSSSKAFHGAGLGFFMCVAAGTGEWLGGTSTTGVAEYAYSFGISGAWYTIANGIGVAVLAIFFAKLYRSLNVVTVPAILGKFAGPAVRSGASFLLMFVMIAVGTAQVVGAGALGVSVLGIDFTLSVIILGIGFIVYTLFGGMLAVAYTNILHVATMYGGVILALAVVSLELGGVTQIFAKLPAEPYGSMMGVGKGTVFSWIIASVLGACTAQAGIQPLLAAKDEKTAVRAAFATALLIAPFGLIVAMLGMAARLQYPDLANAKLALPTLMMGMHPLVGGAVLASIMAAILSTISPLILATGTMFTVDIYKGRINPGASDDKIMKVSRLSTGISGVICIVLALLLYGTTRILDMVYFAYTLRGSLFVILLYAIYWRKSTNNGAFRSMVFTAIVGFFWVAWKAVFGVFPIHPSFSETFAAVLAASISMPLLSLLEKKPVNESR